MASRGSKATNGHVTTTEYKMKDSNSYVYDAKVLVGTSPKNHGLPDYSHTPNSKYIKENPDGSFREMRIYGGNGEPLREIGYHPEQSLTGNRHEYVLHYHIFEANLNRVMGGRVSETENAEIYDKYKKYLKGYGL
jgi:hypothetical protein